MQNSPTPILVVAAWLRDSAGRFLLQERPASKHHAGLWEFPGGKVESGETPRSALCRELLEELALVTAPEEFSPCLVSDEGAGGRIVLVLYTALLDSASPEAKEGQQWGWFTSQQALELPMPPMDADLLARLPQ